MKKTILLLSFIVFSIFSYSQEYWKDLAVTENTEIYVDSLSIKEVDQKIYATTKTVYTTNDARDTYTNRIKRVFKLKDVDKKISKWSDFSYSITHGVYDCQNKRFKITEIQDFRSDGTRIIKTKTKEDQSKWLLIDIDTVGDYVLFYICDYENR